MSEFISTDVDIAFDIASGFTIDDIDAITIRIERDEFSVTKTLGSGITLVDGYFVLSVRSTDITETGLHSVYARITDKGGRLRGIRLKPDTIDFVRFPI
jgi:hypothetical protein